MIYIVEIPHQRPASCWVASNESDFCTRMFETYQRHGDTPEDLNDFTAWCEYLEEDLHILHVFVTDEEAIASLSSNAFDHPQGARARRALEDKLTVCEALPEQERDWTDGLDLLPRDSWHTREE